jgi:hypothetical protein
MDGEIIVGVEPGYIRYLEREYEDGMIVTYMVNVTNYKYATPSTFIRHKAIGSDGTLTGFGGVRCVQGLCTEAECRQQVKQLVDDAIESVL